MLNTFLTRRRRRAALGIVIASTLVASTVFAVVGGSTAEAAGCTNVGYTSIKTAQAKLKASGFWLNTADGYYGPLTRQAIYAFQKYKYLPRTGCADAATVKRIA